MVRLYRNVAHLSLAALLVLGLMALFVGPHPASASEPNNTLAPDENSQEKLLQFTSGGHVLGFSSEGVLIASVDHMVKTKFVDANVVVPETDGGTSVQETAAKL